MLTQGFLRAPTPSSKNLLIFYLVAIEKESIIQALRKTGGVQVEAAKLLGLEHKNL